MCPPPTKHTEKESHKDIHATLQASLGGPIARSLPPKARSAKSPRPIELRRRCRSRSHNQPTHLARPHLDIHLYDKAPQHSHHRSTSPSPSPSPSRSPGNCCLADGLTHAHAPTRSSVGSPVCFGIDPLSPSPSLLLRDWYSRIESLVAESLACDHQLTGPPLPLFAFPRPLTSTCLSYVTVSPATAASFAPSVRSDSSLFPLSLPLFLWQLRVGRWCSVGIMHPPVHR